MDQLHNLKLVQLNCRSLYNKLSEIKIYIYSKKPHIVCISETWLVGDKLPNFINYTCMWQNRTNRRGGGLGILVRSDIPIIPKAMTTFNDDLEVQHICIGMKNCHLDILNIYNPNRATNAAIFSKYFDQLGDHAIILGDFNAHNEMWSIDGTPANTAGNALARLLQTRDNLCLATPPGMVTYMDPRTGKKSLLDLCLVTPDLAPAAKLNVGPCVGSDHFPVEIELNIKPESNKTKSRQRYKLEGVNWSEWRMGLPEIDWRPGDRTVESLSEELSEKIKSSTYCIQKTSGIYNPKYSQPWWSPECERLVAARRRAKNIFMRHPTEENLRILRHAENVVKRETAKAKEKSWKKFVGGINSFTGSKTVWNNINKMRSKYKPSKHAFDHNDQIYTDPQHKANLLADTSKKYSIVRSLMLT